MDEYQRGRRRILVAVYQDPENISDEWVSQQITALKAEITPQCMERFLEVVRNIRVGDIKNVTEAEEELEKEPCC